jgi:glyceraldehyde-3-phosphate dehydrogenase/erythrose-4-phosphate dehydrogenase
MIDCYQSCFNFGFNLKLRRYFLGIVRGSITTIHNVTNTQTIVDAPNAKAGRCTLTLSNPR